ncbi:hypothetical protein Q3G72_004049 [Acer saccharum]|nr:hypothetical protein Q3G72_004049 [Acer saccharum]
MTHEHDKEELLLEFPDGTTPVSCRVSIYDGSTDKKVGVGSLMAKAVTPPLPLASLYMEEMHVKFIGVRIRIYSGCCCCINKSNSRCREKHRKEASPLRTVNRKLSAMNKLLMEENDHLQKQVSHLVYENGYMQTQLQSLC